MSQTRSHPINVQQTNVETKTTEVCCFLLFLSKQSRFCLISASAPKPRPGQGLLNNTASFSLFVESGWSPAVFRLATVNRGYLDIVQIFCTADWNWTLVHVGLVLIARDFLYAGQTLQPQLPHISVRSLCCSICQSSPCYSDRPCLIALFLTPHKLCHITQSSSQKQKVDMLLSYGLFVTVCPLASGCVRQDPWAEFCSRPRKASPGSDNDLLIIVWRTVYVCLTQHLLLCSG